MKQKIITFIISIFIYGLFFGTMIYFSTANKDLHKAILAGCFFGLFMGIFEIFINPKNKDIFKKNKKP
jgi:ABC-type Mn2+/Zn2+ transport system permease subunit